VPSSHLGNRPRSRGVVAGRHGIIESWGRVYNPSFSNKGCNSSSNGPDIFKSEVGSDRKRGRRTKHAGNVIWLHLIQ
jgi:hypothetical protein